MVGMIACNQRKCQHLAYDGPAGETVCTLKDPRFYRLNDSRSFILKCGAYHRRTDWTADGRAPVRHLVVIEPEDYLYPGQLAPPADYTDIDPDEIVAPTEHEEAECST
jgi:hypothetical protein